MLRAFSIATLRIAAFAAWTVALAGCGGGANGELGTLDPGSGDANKNDKKKSSNDQAAGTSQQGEQTADKPVIVAGAYLTVVPLKTNKSTDDEFAVAVRIDGLPKTQSLKQARQTASHVRIVGQLAPGIQAVGYDHPNHSVVWDSVILFRRSKSGGGIKSVRQAVLHSVVGTQGLVLTGNNANSMALTQTLGSASAKSIAASSIGVINAISPATAAKANKPLGAALADLANGEQSFTLTQALGAAADRGEAAAPSGVVDLAGAQGQDLGQGGSANNFSNGFGPGTTVSGDNGFFSPTSSPTDTFGSAPVTGDTTTYANAGSVTGETNSTIAPTNTGTTSFQPGGSPTDGTLSSASVAPATGDTGSVIGADTFVAAPADASAATGVAGVTGATGDTGATGPAVAAADTGATGPAVAAADTGSTGATGDTGATGSSVAAADTGSTGDTGAVASTAGDTGSAGATGDTSAATGTALMLTGRSTPRAR